MDADSLNLIGVNDFRANPSFDQFDGSGPNDSLKYSIAVLGTGAQLNHSAFGQDVAAPIGIADRIVHQQNFREPAQTANEVDENGPGTGVAHVIADMAPGVNLVILKVFNPGDSPTLQAPTIAQALQWVSDNRETFNIVAAQLAFTTSVFYEEVADPNNQEPWVVQIDPKLQQLESQGVAVITQAGDTHHHFSDAFGKNKEGLLYPASSRFGISVGSVWDKNEGRQNLFGEPEHTNPDQISGRSHRDRAMLDLFAPGAFVTAATINSAMQDHWGTRFAAAHVAAAVALAQDVNESLYEERLTTAELDTLLKSTAEMIFDGDDELQDFGGTTPTNTDYKRLDVEALALEIARPTVDLYFESDWGFSETDEITGDSTPTFVGTAPAGWHAWLYVDGVKDVNAPVDAMGNYSLTATAQGTGLKNFIVKVAINSTVADIYHSSSAALPVDIVPSETLTSPTTFQVRMNEDLVLSGMNSADSQIQAAWPTATTRTLTKTGTGAVAIPDPNPEQLIKISDRTVTLTYIHSGGTSNFNVNTGTASNEAATKWTVEAHAPGVVFNAQVQNLAKLDIRAGGVATIAYTVPPNPPTGQEIPYKVLHVRELAIAGTDINPTGKLDITNNALIIDYGNGANPEMQIRKWLIAGRGTTDFIGLWTGNGITSSTAASNPHERSVGYADNATMPLGALSVFVGYAVDSTDVLVRYTVWGDTNLDGSVNDDDVTVQGATYAPGVSRPFWSSGDLDYNGYVDDDDVTALGALYNPLFDIDKDATPGNP